MILIGALPPELFEIITCATATTAWWTWLICIRYLATQVVAQRAAARALFVKFGAAEIVHAILQLRLAIGLTVILSGAAPATTWEWIARFLVNTRHNANWMGGLPWVLLPMIAGVLWIVGLSWVIRAILPVAWGRWGYIMSIGSAVTIVIFTQLPAVRSFGAEPVGPSEYAFGLVVGAALIAILWNLACRFIRFLGERAGKQG